MADANPLPSRRELRELFDYDPETGRLFYKAKRPRRLFASNALWIRYHKSYAGREIVKAPSHRYTQVRIGYTKYAIHRIIWKMMTGTDVPIVDHANRNEADNRWDNLRACDSSQSNANRRVKKAHYARKGVILFKGYWRAACGRDYLGTFPTEEAAHAAYVKAARAKYGEFFHDGS